MRLFGTLLILGMLTSSAPAEPTKGVPLSTVLRGRVESMEGRRVRVVYDFSSPTHTLDFEEVNPFLASAAGSWRIESGALVAEGVGALRWRPVLETDFKVTFKVKLREPHDVGGIVVEPVMSERAVIYAIADRFYSKRDRQREDAHMINCLGVKEPFSDSESQNVFRYVQRKWEPVVSAGAELTVSFGKSGKQSFLELGGTRLEGTDIDHDFAKVCAGLYVLESGASFTQVTIEGVLDADWLDSAGVSYDPAAHKDGGRAPERPTSPDGRRPEPRDDGTGDRDGVDEMVRVRSLLRKVKNTDLPDADREKAAEEIRTRKRIADVPQIMMEGLLYEDDETTRRLGIDMLKAITGTTLRYNYREKDSGDRNKAAGEWWTWITKFRTKIDRDMEKGGAR